MRHYPESLGLALIQKYLFHPKVSFRSLAKEFGVSKTAVHEWVSNYCNGNNLTVGIPSNKWTTSQRLKAIRDCCQLDEESIGSYYRSHGIYREHLDQWRTSFMEENTDDLKWQIIQAENLELKKENIQLQKALKKSNQSLTEVTALLDLKKVSLFLQEKKTVNFC